MKQKSKLNLEINLRSKAWGLSFNGRDLHLTALHNKLNQLRYKGTEVLENFEQLPDEEIVDFIDEFQTRHGVKRGDAFMLLPRSEVEIQIVEFPKEAAGNLDEVMEYQLGNYFAGDLDGFSFFPQIVGNRDPLKVMVVAVRNEFLGHAFSFIRRWGVKAAGLSLDTFGIVNGLARMDADRFKHSKIMIFHAYPHGLEMMGLKEGRLVSSHYFPMPGEELEEGEWPEEGEEAQVQEWSAAQLVNDLEQGFSMARLDPNEVDDYIWAGEYQQEARLYLSEEVGIPFEDWADPLGEVVPPEGLTGFGAATSAVIDNLHLDLNMLPEKQRKRHQRLPVLLGSGLLILLCLFLLVKEVKQFSGMLDRHERLEATHSKIISRMADISSARLEFESKQVELELYKQFQTNKMLVKMLATMANDLPDDTYLTSLIIKKGNQITIQGESDDPFKTQRIMSDMPFLKDVKPSNAITPGRNRDGKRRFIFKARIVLEELS